MTSRFASLTAEQDIENIVEDWEREKKLREPVGKKELAQTLKTFYVEARKKEFVQCIIKQ